MLAVNVPVAVIESAPVPRLVAVMPLRSPLTLADEIVMSVPVLLLLYALIPSEPALLTGAPAVTDTEPPL